LKLSETNWCKINAEGHPLHLQRRHASHHASIQAPLENPQRSGHEHSHVTHQIGDNCPSFVSNENFLYLAPREVSTSAGEGGANECNGERSSRHKGEEEASGFEEQRSCFARPTRSWTVLAGDANLMLFARVLLFCSGLTCSYLLIITSCLASCLRINSLATASDEMRKQKHAATP
jgi:hypothetical protein